MNPAVSPPKSTDIFFFFSTTDVLRRETYQIVGSTGQHHFLVRKSGRDTVFLLQTLRFLSPTPLASLPSRGSLACIFSAGSDSGKPAAQHSVSRLAKCERRGLASGTYPFAMWLMTGGINLSLPPYRYERSSGPSSRLIGRLAEETCKRVRGFSPFPEGWVQVSTRAVSWSSYEQDY